MTHPTRPKPLVTLKASRDTLLLVAAAVAVTFALSYAVHRRPAPSLVAVGPAPLSQPWVGQLPDTASADTVARSAEPITSASLVVSPAALPSPAPPVRAAVAPAAMVSAAGVPAAAVPAKARPCETQPCPVAAKAGGLSTPPAPPVKQTAALAADDKPAPVKVQAEKVSLIGRLNPLNHIPDAIRHPLDAAGDTFSSWMKRL